jgi:HlyD family secretion protein
LKVAIWIIVGLGAVLGTAWMVVPRFRGGAGPEATIVKVEAASKADLIETVSAPGEIQPKKRVQISAKVAAPIVKLPFKEGETVKKGDLLVELDNKDLKAVRRQVAAQWDAQKQQIEVARQRIESQKAAIRASKATLADLQRDLDRNKSLVATHDVSQSVLDTAQAKFDEEREQIDSAEKGLDADVTNLKVMDAQLEAAKAQVDKADEDISYTRIESPLDGIITALKAEEGEMVMTGTMNNAGTMILEVADMNTMLMVAKLDESQIDPVKEGQHAIVRIQAFRDVVFDGVVESVGESRTTDQLDQTKYFQIKVRLLDLKGRRVRSGLSADVEIQTQKHDGVIRVPSQAVMSRPLDQLPENLKTGPEIEKGKSFATVVFRMIDNKAVLTPVTVGPSDDTHTIIKSGLKANDPVIVGPYKILETLSNEQGVKLEGAGPTTRKS